MMTPAEMAQKILAQARVIKARPKRHRSKLAQSILIHARVIQLRRLAERTAAAYREAAVVDTDLPPRHRELRRMLLGIAARRDRKAIGCRYPDFTSVFGAKRTWTDRRS